MKIEIDLNKCKVYRISPSQYTLLYLLYHNDMSGISKYFGLEKAKIIRNSMCDGRLILSNKELDVSESVLSRKVKNILGITSDNLVNFAEFYNRYPLKVGARALRAARLDSKSAKKHKISYLKHVKTVEEHERICKIVDNYVQIKKIANELQFLPLMETLINGRKWEEWEVFYDEDDNIPTQKYGGDVR